MFHQSNNSGREDERYAFLMEYFDEQADLLRKYQLLYHLQDESIEIYDMKSKRIFLKRIKYPSLKLDQLYQGNAISIYGRQYTITGYGDEFTMKKFASLIQKTLVVVLPEGKSQLGQLIQLAEKNSLKLTNLITVQLSVEEARQLYGDSQDILQHITGTPLIVMELTGQDAVQQWKSIMSGTPTLASNSNEDVSTELEFYFGGQRNISNSPVDQLTLGLIKPHAVTDGLTGPIVQDIIDSGFSIEHIQMFALDKTNASDFLEVYKGVVPEFSAMVTEYSNGTCVVLQLTRSRISTSIVEDFRSLCGPMDPELGRLLRPDSLRARYGRDKVQNAIHCTDLEEDARLEIEFFSMLNQQ